MSTCFLFNRNIYLYKIFLSSQWYNLIQILHKWADSLQTIWSWLIRRVRCIIWHMHWYSLPANGMVYISNSYSIMHDSNEILSSCHLKWPVHASMMMSPARFLHAWDGVCMNAEPGYKIRDNAIDMKCKNRKNKYLFCLFHRVFRFILIRI